MYEEKINADFDAPERRAALVEAISRLVRIRSVREEPLPGMPFGPGPAAALAEGLKLAEELGFATRNYDNYVGTADLNDKETALHILCHLDVVGEGTGWTVTEPYAPKEVDGMLYGRGTDDDKGPVAAVLLAMKAVKELGVPLRRNARLLMGTDEESGSSDGQLTSLEEKVFIAAALAHNQTGRPISTHTSFSTMGLEQLALLQAHGVDLSRVTVGHCDLKDNLDNILKMIDLGAYVQFDTIGKNSYYPDERRIAMLHALRDRGLLNRVMLSMDITRRSHLKANGGYGYDYLLTTFIPQLRQSGFSQADVDVMLRETPSQFFQ